MTTAIIPQISSLGFGKLLCQIVIDDVNAYFLGALFRIPAFFAQIVDQIGHIVSDPFIIAPHCNP